MAKDAVYEGRREVKTFVDLDHGAKVLIMKTKEEEKGSYYTTMAALLLTAFTFEAYLNHLGKEKIIFWDEIESIRVMHKYAVLCKEFKMLPDFSKRPYNTLKSLLIYRNAIAHGRSRIGNDTLEVTKEVSSQCDPYDCAPKTHWEEYCTLSNAEQAKKDVTEIIIELHKHAGLGDHPFSGGMSMGSLTLR